MSETTDYEVVFDVGGVLVDWNPNYLYNKVIQAEERRKWFLETVCNGEWNSKQDSGRSWQDAEEELLNEFPGFEAEIRAFRGRWIEMIGGETPGGFQLLEDVIASNTSVSILSNWADDTFDLTCEMYPKLAQVSRATVSGKVGVAKPDAEIFVIHEERFGLNPRNIVFIDDNKANIAAAERRGWAGILFEDSTQVRERLGELNVL